MRKKCSSQEFVGIFVNFFSVAGVNGDRKLKPDRGIILPILYVGRPAVATCEADDHPSRSRTRDTWVRTPESPFARAR